MANRQQILRVQILWMWLVLMLWLANICRAILRVLARLANIRQAEFGECYVNLVSLANLASVG